MLVSRGELNKGTKDFIVEAFTGNWRFVPHLHRDAQGKRIINLRDRLLGTKETDTVLEQLTA